MSCDRQYHCKLLVQGYVRMVLKKVNSKLVVPDDIIFLFSNFYFIPFDSLIVNNDCDINQLFELLSKQISIKRLENTKLLMRATRDGGQAKDMFLKLENNGPYLFIIKSSDDYIFGAYCTVNIEKEQSGKFLSDDKAFIYTLKGASSKIKGVYTIKSSAGKKAVEYDSGRYLFIFGPFGADIVLYNGLVTAAYSHYCCRNNGSGLKYKVPSNKTLVGTKSRYSFTMCEMEVFQVPFDDIVSD